MDTIIGRFKYQAFLEEFPDFAKVVGEAGISEGICADIKVKRITGELLEKTPNTTVHIGSLVGIDEGDKVYFVVDNELVDVFSAHSFFSNYAHEDGHTSPGETLLEACDRAGVPNLIIWIEYGLGTVDHYSNSDWKATIYKPARYTDIPEMLKIAREKAREQVMAESAF